MGMYKVWGVGTYPFIMGMAYQDIKSLGCNGLPART